MSSNKRAKQKLIDKYGSVCFIEELKIRKLPPDTRFQVSKKDWKKMNQLTYHHIIMKKDGGKATMENGALLKAYNHEWFHKQSLEDQAKMNEMFQEYKRRYDKAEVEFVDKNGTDFEIKVATFDIDNDKEIHVYNRAKVKEETRRAVNDYYEHEKIEEGR